MKKIYDVHYANGRSSLVIEADLDRGWEKLQKAFGFFQQTRVPFRRDLTIRTQLTLIAQPGSFAAWTHEFPNTQLEQGDSSLHYSISARQLVINRRVVARAAVAAYATGQT